MCGLAVYLCQCEFVIEPSCIYLPELYPQNIFYRFRHRHRVISVHHHET